MLANAGYVLPTATALTIASGGTVDLNGGPETVASLAGSGAIANSATSAATFTVGGPGSSTFGGTISDGFGQVALNVSGGSLTLSGTNTYTGGTTVDGGTLIVTNNEAIEDNSNLFVGNALTLFGGVIPAGTSVSQVASPAGAPVPEPGTLALAAAVLGARPHIAACAADFASWSSGFSRRMKKPPGRRGAAERSGLARHEQSAWRSRDSSAYIISACCSPPPRSGKLSVEERAMATLNDRAGQRPFGPGRGPRPIAAWLLLTLLVCLPGCRGCNRTPEQIEKDKQLLAEEEEKKKEQEKIKPFEAGEPESLPTRSLAAHGMCKPGHWIGQTWYDLKSNLGDFQGEIQTEAVDSKIARVQLPGVPYRLSDERPASLAKEQAKTLESITYVPPKAESVNFKLATASGATIIERPLSLKAMPSFRYFFVVLSKGSRFAYLNDRLDSIRLHQPATSDPGPEYYQVVTMQPNRRPGLPAARCAGRASPICSGTTRTRPSGTSISSRRWSIGCIGAGRSSSAGLTRWSSFNPASCGPTCRPRWVKHGRLRQRT